MSKAQHDDLRDRGEADFKAGKPIDAFYELPVKRNPELYRSSYETGWRSAQSDAQSSDNQTGKQS